MEFTLNLVDTPFVLSYTLDSGQVFRWESKDGWWYGVLEKGVVKMKQEGYSLSCISGSDEINSSFIRRYFRLDEDLKVILTAIMKDSTITEAIQRFYGLRLIRQTIWECLVSFTLATNSNIPNIKRMISNICQRFGERIEFEGVEYSLFPSPKALASASIQELVGCGLGYRARFVKSVSRAVYEGDIDVSELLLHDYSEARDLLLRKLFGKKIFLGIGPKVADCVLLFSCEKVETFPIDVWIARTILRYYSNLLDKALCKKFESRLSKKVTITLKEYDLITLQMKNYFGKYAGYAQQYLYMYSRIKVP